MTARRAAAGLAVALLVAAGVWFHQNASQERLRRKFQPEIAKLEGLRDGLDDLRRALRSGVDAPRVPAAAAIGAVLRAGLVRVDVVDYDLEAVSGDGPTGLSARASLTIAGRTAEGLRVERVAVLHLATETANGALRRLDVAAGWGAAVRERSESFPRFADGTAEAGLGAPRNDPDEKVSNWLIEGIWPGSGAALLDADGDGIDDLFVCDGRASILYRNDGCGHFTDVTEASGLASPPIAGTGVVAADLDGDGFDDLFVTNNFGPSKLFRSRGDGTFEDVTAQAGVGTSTRSRSAAVADVDRDGDLDVFVCSTGDYYHQMPDPPFDAHDGNRNYLFLNRGDGTFEEAGVRFGLEQTQWSLTAQFADLDADGFQDLVVTNDFGLKNVFHNEGGRRFADVAGKAGLEDRGYGMSAAVADVDGDGDLDVHTTGTYTQWGLLHERPWIPMPLPGRLFLPVARAWLMKMCAGDSLYLARGDGTWENATAASGIAKGGWAWSGVFGDLDNDGWPDLYVANGMWDDGRDGDRELEFWYETLAYWDDYVAGKKAFDRKGKGVHGRERNRYFRNRGDATFEDRSYLDGVDLAANGRAAILADLNDDGALDVYVRSVQHPETLFFGTRRPGEHYLELRLHQPGLNRAAIGARVTLSFPNGRRMLQELQTTSGFLASGSKRLHFGLGPYRGVAGVSVRWPDGETEEFGPIPEADRVFLLDRGTKSARPLPRVVPPPEGRARGRR